MTDALRKKYTPKINAIKEKVLKAQQVVDREAAQVTQAGVQTALSVGASLLGAFAGRKASGVSKAARSIGRTVEQSGDVGRAKETLQTYQQQLEELNAEFQAELEALASKTDSATETLETVSIKPKKTDITVQAVSLAWAPFRPGEQGKPAAAW